MMINRAKIAYFLPIIYLATLTSCSTAKEYISGIMEDDREGFVVYKRESIYDDTQFNLELPPDLINPSSPDSLSIPELTSEKGMKVFTVDTELNDIKLVRSGRDSFLSLRNLDKEELWKRIQFFWEEEGFRITEQNIALGFMETNYLENLSEAQLGTVQRVIGRYIPLLVSPDTRDSYKTRLIMNEESIEIVITHYGKEYMTDGENEFRWQNRLRDPELETEMTSRMYIFLGGEEARSKGLVIVKATGLRNKSTLNVDENGLHTLYIADAYERVWPRVLRSLEVLGVNIVSSNIDEGLINIALSERDREESFFDKMKFWSGTEEENLILVLTVDQLGTSIEVQNESFVNITSQASEEIIRGLHADLR